MSRQVRKGTEGHGGVAISKEGQGLGVGGVPGREAGAGGSESASGGGAVLGGGGGGGGGRDDITAGKLLRKQRQRNTHEFSTFPSSPKHPFDPSFQFPTLLFSQQQQQQYQ